MNKKLLFILLLFAGMANAQIVNIPDEYFKAKLLQSDVTNATARDQAGLPMKIDANNDGEIQNSEALAVYGLRIWSSFIFDATGISSFTNLTHLEFTNNPMTSLDVRALTHLTHLICSGNRLTSLNVSGLTSLGQLFCDSNRLTNLNLTGLSNISTLYCSDNPLGTLDLSTNTSLVQLFCANNNLTTLNLSGLTNITLLMCENNALTNLDLTGLSNLDLLFCGHNLLTNINVSHLPNLKTLNCYYNQITALDLSNSTQLTNLSCGENSIPVLNLNGLVHLTALECSYLPNNVVINGTDLDALTSFQYTGQNSNITFNGFPAVETLNLTLLQSNVTLNVTGFGGASNINLYGSATNTLTVNGSGALNLESFNCSNIQLNSLALNGLNNLKSLYCNNNKLTSLNLTNLASLTRLDISNNNIATLDISGLPNLKRLDCGNNKLTGLNLSGVPNLEYLDCSNTYYVEDPVKNQITNLNLTAVPNLKYLDFSNRGFLGMLGALGNVIPSLNVNQLIHLEQLRCTENKIPTLVVNGLTNLTHLDCSNNLLTSLDLIGLTNLTQLSYRGNQLSNLNMTGLINITELDCSYNNISTLNVVNMPNLTRLYCNSNILSTLNLTGLTHLTDLNCTSNLLTTIDVSHLTNLQYLHCGYNQLTNLDVNNLTALINFSCSSNLLTNLNVSALINLTTLTCFANQLTSLDVSTLVNVYELSCGFNQLTTLNVSNLQLLSNLNCVGNQITDLDLSALTNIGVLNCSNNELTSLNVTTLPNLYELNCDHNQITTLDVSTTNHLRYLVCSDNQLTQLFMKNGSTEDLNLSNNPVLTYICADDAELAVVQTQLNTLGMTATVCNSYCSVNPGGPHNTVVGTTIFDGNNNGCNINDPLHPNIRIDFSDGTTTGSAFTNTLGESTFYATAGDYTIFPNIENAAAFNISPASAVINFPNANYNVINQSFCLSANGVHPDLEVVIIPIGPARPGFDAAYKIVYKNKGNQILSGNVTLAFDDSRIDFISALPVAATQTANNLEWAYNGLLPFESRSIKIEFNVNAPTETPAVNNGDILNFTTSITPVANDESPFDNAFTFNQTVVGPFDPNNITCIEGDVVSPSEIGNYLHYVVNFENTGTAAAENVVVKLEINPDEFDISSLQIMDTSHDAFAQITGNVVEFKFPNINLQPAGDPPVNGHGNILFKMKSDSALNVGDLVKNRANIFFDYNFPIETDAAETVFESLKTDEFANDTSVVVYPNPAHDLLKINSSNTIKTVELYDVQGRILQVFKAGKTEAQLDLSRHSKGIYFVKIITGKGKKVEKIIKE